MRGIHRLCVIGRVQIFCLLVLFTALETLAASIELTMGGSELDNILKSSSLPADTFYFPETDNQLIFNLSSHYPSQQSVTLTFIHTGTDPDKYPILKHTGNYDNYNFLMNKNLSFTRVIFESENATFFSSEPSSGEPHTKYFNSCVFRNINSKPLFKFEGELSTNITFENCLFYDNSHVAEFRFWNNGNPVIKVTHCTFGNNGTIFTFLQNFSENWVQVTNSIFSNNTHFIYNQNIFDKMNGSVNGDDALFVSVTGDRSEPSHWKLSEDSEARAFCNEVTDVSERDISNTIRGTSNEKYDAGCWALLLGGPPSITLQPKGITVAEGTEAIFNVEANGSEPLSYQWYKNDEAITGETSSELKFVAPTEEGEVVEFYCVISNKFDTVTSEVCTLTIVKKPQFTEHPKESTVIEGESVFFSASALRADSYYWIAETGDSINEGSELVLESVSLEQNGKQYRCVAVNIAGSDTSNPATLTVIGKTPVIVKQPEMVAVLKNDIAIFYLNASGSSLKYAWYKIGDPDTIPVGTDNDSLIIEDATENGVYFCVVSNDFGVVTSDNAELMIIDSGNPNPLFIKEVRMVDRDHVLISLQRFDVLPAVAGVQPYVDSIGIWYEEGKYPNSPIRGVLNFVPISMNEILGSGSSTFEKIIEINRRDCITYFFVASPFWKNPDTIPPFNAANGASAFMCSTEKLANPMEFKKIDYKSSGTIDVEITGFEALENKKDSLEHVLVWYSLGQEVVNCDTLKKDTLEKIWSASEATWSKSYEDALFSGPEEIITFNVSWRGILGNYSDTVKEEQSVGTARTVNYCTLTVDSVRSTSIKLRWSKEQGDNIEKVRIWYGSKPIPVNQGFDTTEYDSITRDANHMEVLIDNLSENTLYYFGLQTYVSGQYWSFVTEQSCASAKTMNPGALPNTISITDISFDSSTNRIILNWNMDTAGISGSKLKTGFWWDITDEKGSPSKGFKIIDSTLSRPDVMFIDIGHQFLVDTTYHFALWMGYEGKDGVYRWAEPESDAKKTLRIPQPGWQKITYFKPDNDSIALFNNKIVLKPGDNWSNAIYEDTLLVFKPDLSSLKPGLIPVSMGIDFYRNHPSNEIYMSLTCDSLPEGYSTKDVFMYQYDELTDSISVLPRISFDESGRTVTSSFKPHLKHFPFMLMIDTQEPVVKVMSDTATVISAKTSVIDMIKVSDNIINSKVKLFIYRNDDSLFEVSSEMTSWHEDTIVTTIDSNYVFQNHSVFAWLVVTDERNTKWINISRQVIVDFNNATITKDIWNPVSSHSVLDSPSTPVAIGKISSEPQWKYDNTHFRIFTWDRLKEVDTSTWVEYSDENKDLFSFVPGRIFWVKTRETKAINLGKGVTFPLKNTFSDIVLSAKSFTDFALPVHFNVVVQDILDSTSQNQEQITELLGFYKWIRDDKGLYQTRILYQPNAVQFNNSGVVLEPDSCYSIYNHGSNDIKLRIPLITEKMSTRKENGEGGSLEKNGFAETWNITIHARTDEELISPVYCGFSPGKGRHCFPVSPSFSKIRAGVLDSDQSCVHGMVVAHEKKDNGITFPLVFDNSDSESKNVHIKLENWGSMPADYKVSIFNPDAATYDNQNNSFLIGAGQREYRFLVAGDENYIANWKSSFTKFSFSLLKAYPNPFRGRIQIRFMLPYSGVSRIRMAVYDQLGRRLWRKDLDKNLHPGENIIVWDANTASRLAAGTYILQLTALDGSGKVKGVKRERIMFMP